MSKASYRLQDTKLATGRFLCFFKVGFRFMKNPMLVVKFPFIIHDAGKIVDRLRILLRIQINFTTLVACQDVPSIAFVKSANACFVSSIAKYERPRW